MAKRLQRTMARPGQESGPAKGAGPRNEGSRRRGPRVPAQLVTDFTVQLATLTGAGISIVKALTVLEGQMKPGPFKVVLGELVEDVAAGTPLSESMSKHERVFDRLYSEMVHAGEVGGVLDTVLTRLASFREKAATIRSKVVGALVYPAVVVCVAVAVVSVVIVWVIPKFREIFQSFNVGLPTMTQLLLDISELATGYWYLVFGLPILLFFAHLAAMRRGGGYRFTVHGLMLRLPVMGEVLRTALIAGFSRTFGTLIEAGVPHLDALVIVRDTSPNDVLVRSVEDVRRTVREGEAIAAQMAESTVFDDLVVNMVDVGEETGELDHMLLRVADAYENQVDRKIDTMFKVLEPALLIVMAIMVGFIVVALFMPLMSIMNQLQGSG